jgi:hypothetical protein
MRRRLRVAVATLSAVIGSPSAHAAIVSIMRDGERDRAGRDVIGLSHDRPVGSLSAVDDVAVEGAAVDVAERLAVNAREVAIGAGLDGAAELGADGLLAAVEHRRRPLRLAEIALCIGIPKPWLDGRQVRTPECA